MKRFFCSTCRRVKRTQQWPYIIDNVQSENVFERVGECNYHRNGRIVVHSTKPKFVKTKPVVQTVSKRRKAS